MSDLSESPHSRPSSPSTPTALFQHYLILIQRARTYLPKLSNERLASHDNFRVTYEVMEEGTFILMDVVVEYPDVVDEYVRWEDGMIDGEEFIRRVQRVIEVLEELLEWE